MSLPTPPSVLRPTLIGGEWDQPCRAWDGRPADYGVQAVIAAQHRLGKALPWVNAEPVCGTPMCLTEAHLALHIPRRIAYPSGVCVYCGMPAYTKDHLLPRTATGDALRKFVAVVPACGECNFAINDRGSHRISQRRELAHEHIARKYRKFLDLADRWPASELRQLGPILRKSVKAGLEKGEVAQARLAWPDDLDYDLRAFQRTGFEDPRGLDLL